MLILLNIFLTVCFDALFFFLAAVGNRRFRNIIADAIDEYNSAGSRKAKSTVVKRVHDAIRATGGRFLRFDSSQRTWVELGQQRSLEKVSHAIRDATSTNENVKKRKERLHTSIAEVAAQVSSRLPSVHLEHKLDDDDDQRLAFMSIECTLPSAMPSLTSGRPVVAGQLPSAATALDQDSQIKDERLAPTDDDFVHYINEALGPVSPDDLRIDPLKKLETRRRRSSSRREL